MVPAIATLGEGSASKFGSPDEQGVIEETAPLQVLEEGRDGLVDTGRDGR